MWAKYSLKTQLIVVYLLILAISVLAISYTIINRFEDFHLLNLKTNMEQDIRLIAENVKDKAFTSVAFPHSYIQYLSEIVDARVTFVALDGEVIADSAVIDVATMDNHSNRIEIKQAIQEKDGFESRFSKTLKTGMYYTAYRIDDDRGQPVGVVRLARPLTEIDQLVKAERQKIIYSLFGIALFMIVISVIMITRFTKPIHELSTAIAAMSDDNYGKQILEQGNSSELTKLIHSFNRMSTEIKEKITAVKTHETQLATIISNMVSGLLLINPAGDIVLSNPAANQLFPVEDHKPKNYVLVIRHTEIMRLIAICIKDKTNQWAEVEISSTGKDKMYYKVAVTPLMMPNSHSFLGVLVLLHDITEIRRIEQSRRDLIANVSHELRTPITSIMGFSETLLSDDMMSSEDQKEFLGIIHSEAQRLKKLIEDLLQLAKLEAGQLSITLEKVDSKDLLTLIYKRLYPSCQNKGINLNLTIADLPPIYADAFRLEQALINIVVNAIKFTSPGGSITIFAEPTSTHLEFKVQDTGIGIPAEQLGRIFERFYRIDQGRLHSDDAGYGLGLTIVKHLTEAQNGYLAIDSEVNKGTTVTVAMPLWTN